MPTEITAEEKEWMEAHAHKELPEQHYGRITELDLTPAYLLCFYCYTCFDHSASDEPGDPKEWKLLP